MKRRFVDLSIYLENDVISDPPPFGPKIQYHKHEQTAGQIAQFFLGLKKEDLPDGAGWAVENVNLSTHNCTHLDAPYHCHPTMNKGERAITIDEVPLEWCFQPGVKLDFRDKQDGHVITAQEVEDELKRIGHELSPLEIVVVNTRAGSRYGNDDYVNSGWAWATTPPCTCSSAASASPAPTPGAGTRRSTSPPRSGRRTTIPRSSGKATRLAATSATATSRNCTISNRCPAMGSPSPASPTRFAAQAPAGRGRSRSSRSDAPRASSGAFARDLLKPARALEAEVEPATDRDDRGNHGVVAVLPLQFGHVLEIHAVDARDRGGHRQDRGPGGELAGDRVLLRLARHQARLEGEGQHLAQRVDVFLDAADMVADVAEQRLHLRLDQQVVGMFQPAADVDQWHHRLAQPQQLAAQDIEAVDLGLGKGATEHAVFQRIDLALHGLHDRDVFVDDEVEDRIEDVVLAARQAGRAGLVALPHGGIGGRRPVTDRHDVALADEDVGLAEVDLAIDDLRGAGHDEQRIAI